MGRRRLRVLLWTLLAALALAFVTQAYIAGVYHIDSGSMEPTLHGPGEYVLVRYGRPDVQRRFDIVVVSSPTGESSTVVKRVVGLPGESIQIQDGDLRIDGRRLPEDEPRVESIPLFDHELQEAREFFEFGETWDVSGDAWSLGALDVDERTSDGLMMSRPITDGYRDSEGVFHEGKVPVRDVMFECEARIESPIESTGSRLRFRIEESRTDGRGDSYVFLVEVVETPLGSELSMTLLRRSSPDPEEVLASAKAPFAPGAWHRVRVSSLDRRLRLEWDGETLLAAVAGGAGSPRGLGGGQGPHLGARVSFGGDRIEASFRSVRIWRDVHYTHRGSHAVGEPLHLGPGEIFLLGDNSRSSRDGREWGPVPSEAVIGHPVAVLWPPGRARRIRSVSEAIRNR